MSAPRFGRPPGEIRQALGEALSSTGGGTWRDLAQRACVGFDAARETLRNMARAGEVAEGAPVRVAGVCRPMTWYEPASAGGCATGAGHDALAAAMRGWADFN